MPLIRLETLIHAPIERCFDLARDIDFHMRSAGHTREIALGGVTTGLIKLGDEVTWEATHFGVRQRLTVKITAFTRPGHFRDSHFRDSMTRGAFRRFNHDHYFIAMPGGATLMRDEFDYDSPLGWLGALADHLFLKAYMRSFLANRNLLIKKEAEGSGSNVL
jgi:ligand-binding SRPBCC domain-containing protein